MLDIVDILLNGGGAPLLLTQVGGKGINSAAAMVKFPFCIKVPSPLMIPLLYQAAAPLCARKRAFGFMKSLLQRFSKRAAAELVSAFVPRGLGQRLNKQTAEMY